EHLRAEAEDVHVVVLDALVRGVDVVADRRANPGHLAGRDRGTDPGAADEHAPLGVAVQDRLADVAGLVGIVDPRVERLHPEIHDRGAGVGGGREAAGGGLAATVVEGNRDPHGLYVTPPRPRRLPPGPILSSGASLASSCAWFPS